MIWKPGKGKRSGLRVLYFHLPEHGRLLLVDVYDKDEQDDLSVQDIARIRKGLGYSQTVFARVLAVSPQTVRGEGQ